MALAELLSGLSASVLERPRSEVALSHAAGLLEAAVRLAPRDERLARELVDARLRLGDIPAALEALDHYRRLRPEDLLAQIRYVDLSAAQMERADARIDYLARVAQTPSVPAEVRSHAAVSASVLLREALDEQGADVLLQEAVSLNPYNPQALQKFYERLLETDEPRARRVDALSLLARSNILQPAVLGALAAELADAGLIDESHEIYQRAIQVHRAMGVTPPLDLMRDVAALQLVADRPDAALQTIAAATESAAAITDSDVQISQSTVVGDLSLLGLLAAQRFSEPGGEQMQRESELTSNRLRFMLGRIGAKLRDQPLPATNPDGTVPQTAMPDVMADIALMTGQPSEAGREQLRLHYASALANFAWLDLYFRAQPTSEPVLTALAALVPEQSTTLQRLRGWQLWRQGDPEAAQTALVQIADSDLLARLALVLIDAERGVDAGSAANELLEREPGGLVGAFLADALRGYGARVQPAEDATLVREALATLPPALFGLLEPQNVRNFYSLSADPRAARREYGEAILLNVSIRNSGRHTITVGPEGLVQPVLRLDALVRPQLQEPQPVPAANAVELWGSVRLDPGEKIEQTVRLDGPVLSALLESRPDLSVTIAADVTTNPALVQTEQGPAHVTGPAGQTRSAGRMVTRAGFALDPADPETAATIDARLEQMRTGSQLQRLRSAQWALGLVQSLDARLQDRQQAGAPEAELSQLRELKRRVIDAVGRAASSVSVSEPDTAGNVWVKYVGAVVAPAARERHLRELLSSRQFEARVVGLLAILPLISEVDVARSLVSPLAEADPDATVRRLAGDVLEQLDQRAAAGPQAPTTQPATSPASQPSAQPTGAAAQ